MYLNNRSEILKKIALGRYPLGIYIATLTFVRAARMPSEGIERVKDAVVRRGLEEGWKGAEPGV